MLITRKFVFVHLQKCGGTSVREYLMHLFPNAIRTPREHDGLRDIPDEHKDKPVLGTVRNPWAWYVSWYFKNREALKQNGGISAFQELFEIDDFKTFLDVIFNKTGGVLHDVDFGRAHQMDVGVYTSRFINCHCPTFEWDSTHVDWYAKTESLAQDVEKFLHHIGVDFRCLFPHSHKSSHGSYRDYYDDESAGWVAHKDRRIIEDFGYRWDSE